jgi:hypothetical protein
MLIPSFGGAAARLVFVAFAIAAFSAAAEAALYISYVASNGNDANPCTVVTAPCQTLSRAYSVTSPNGTIRVLTALQSNLTVAKNITISGDGAPIVGTIVISGASTLATLRGLELNGVGIIANGIRIDSAATVHIENCTVERYAGDGIKLSATTATELFVSDTVSRDNGGSGLLASDVNAHVTVEDSRFGNNGNTGLVLSVVSANVTRSVASRNLTGIYMSAGEMNLTETTAADNVNGFYVASGVVTLASSVASTNGTGLTVASGAFGLITDSVITNNTTGIINSAGTVTTLQNNTVVRNTVNYDTSGVLDPEPAF